MIANLSDRTVRRYTRAYGDESMAVRRAVALYLLSAGQEMPERFWTDCAHDVGAIMRRPGEPYWVLVGDGGSFLSWGDEFPRKLRESAEEAVAGTWGRWYQCDGARVDYAERAVSRVDHARRGAA